MNTTELDEEPATACATALNLVDTWIAEVHDAIRSGHVDHLKAYSVLNDLLRTRTKIVGSVLVMYPDPEL